MHHLNVHIGDDAKTSWFDGEPLIIVSHEEILRIYFTKITQSIDTQ